jgi:hypothetical protein
MKDQSKHIELHYHILKDKKIREQSNYLWSIGV